MVIKNLFGYVKKPENGSVGNGVVHIAPILASDHDVAHSQNCKLLRNVRRFDVQKFAELIDSFLAIAKRVQDANTDWVGQGVYGELLFHQCAPPKLRALSK